MAYDIQLKRVYQPAEPDDGARVLVDRLWPRGKRRESLALTEWYRDASPTPAVRRQYHQGDINQTVFAARYRGELRDAPQALIPLMRHARKGRLTLLSASRDLTASHLPLLRDAVLQALNEEDASDSEPASSPCYLDASGLPPTT
ncbi:DUF488 domain-containing protein [Halomonas urumqiensis]|uniref:DUF488 domain-containing protein n=1 Tax=Halomonas urumqiensis TaxID=1684789 RepID=A0A2N7UQ18_9GAMM|nr:DUF488 family protein [Halomonas urumqiensis]PMR82502.1 hypothetical protein C1H70_01930 [Halomonas urumqiensis]PTB04017.1 DUF488 domain-containing protein [Halomonas urumqiensis]GHE19721.1 hypothetical protein GCM10017767_02420 [Halomonas urumqiensis]